MEVNANGVELLPLAIDGILELLRHIDGIQNVLNNVIHVPVHELVHKLFDLQNSMILEHHEAGSMGSTHSSFSGDRLSAPVL